MEAKVRAFNSLARTEKCSSDDVSHDVSNHWIFGVCHVDLELPTDVVIINKGDEFWRHGPADILIVINTGLKYCIQIGPANTFSFPTTRERAEATIPHLLDAFARRHSQAVEPIAPWTWSTLDPDMAQAIEDGLKKHGVMPERCRVGICSAEERIILDEARERSFAMLAWQIQLQKTTPVAPGDSERCHGCRMKRECFFMPLQKCARCQMAFYHSRKCQKLAWKKHKAGCHAPGTPGAPVPGAHGAPAPGAAPSLSPDDYFNKKAPADPEALALLSSLHVSPGARGGRFPALHKLVYTGQDTPENLRLLYGPNWERAMKAEYFKARMECLLDPPPGSPSYGINNRIRGGSALVKSPRPATEAEEKVVKEIRKMQAKIVQTDGAGRGPTEAAMQAALMSLGSNWDQNMKLQLYSLASLTLDQGTNPGCVFS